MAKSKRIEIGGREISIITQKQDDYISLTDMAKSQMQEAIIIKWLTLKSTIEYIGEWEALYNPDFNYTEFGTIKNSTRLIAKRATNSTQQSCHNANEIITCQQCN